MREVTHDEFFAALYAETRDIMPDVHGPEVTIWKDQRTRAVFGKTLPGWKNGGNPNTPKTYYLVSEK